MDNRHRYWKKQAYAKYVSSGQAGFLSKISKNEFTARSAHARFVIRKYLCQNLDAHILELGCGHGVYIHSLKLAGYKNLRGIDISTEQVELAQSLGVDDVTIGENIETLKSYESNVIDAILLMDIIEHYSFDQLFQLLDEVIRVLKVGGQILLQTPNAEGLFGMRARYGDITHEIAFTPRSIKQILHITAFKNIQVFELKPSIHGFKSLGRRVVWEILTLYPRLLLMAETGELSGILSQNMLVTAEKGTKKRE